MSSEEFEKYDDLNDPSLDGEKSDDLDEYGVWIKKRPSAYDDESSSDVSSVAKDEAVSDASENAVGSVGNAEDEAFDFDGLSDDASLSGDSAESSLKENKEQDLDDVDMSDFFTDFGEDATDENAETEDTLKMDLNFDTMDSFVEDGNVEDDFDAMLNDVENSDSSLEGGTLTEDAFTQDNEFDDLLSSDSNSSSASSYAIQNSDADSSDISLDVNVDEEQSFDKLSDEDSSVVIDSPVDSDEQTGMTKKTYEDDVVIKNTVVEASNIDEIQSKNQEVLNDKRATSLENTKKVSGSMENFNDVDALAKDLAEASVHGDLATSTGSCHANVVSVEGLDKVQCLLQEMAKELTSIREEIVSLKRGVSSLNKVGNDPTSSAGQRSAEHEESGFFKDEDTDEAIALTGDELNNILITADFTEEGGDGATSEEESDDAVGSCEACGENEKNIEDEETDFDSSFEFDDIALENSKLDDFVIPEELDYNMLSQEEENETVAVSDSDMAYLNEKDGDADLPKTQELSTEGGDAHSVNKYEDGEELPYNIKRDIKSVLAYMDQLLESLPEDKIKEFAESEYFEMYHRLFDELGIS